MVKIVEVIWMDVCSSIGWGNPEPQLEKVKSVGYLIVKNEDIICIAQSIDSEGKTNERLTISRLMIKKIRAISSIR